MRNAIALSVIAAIIAVHFLFELMEYLGDIVPLAVGIVIRIPGKASTSRYSKIAAYREEVS